MQSIGYSTAVPFQLLLHFALRAPLPLSFIVMATVSAFLGDFGLPFRHLVEELPGHVPPDAVGERLLGPRGHDPGGRAIRLRRLLRALGLVRRLSWPWLSRRAAGGGNLGRNSSRRPRAPGGRGQAAW